MSSTILSLRPSGSRSIVQVMGAGKSSDHCRRLLSTLSRLQPVSFEGDSAYPDAVFQIGEPSADEFDRRGGAVMTLTTALPITDSIEKADRTQVVFHDELEVPFPFRGRALETSVSRGIKPLTCMAGEQVLASIAAGPIWTFRWLNGRKYFRSALPLEEIPEDGIFAQVFNGGVFLSNLPLLHLLSQLPSRAGEMSPPLRAAFMFDDPNLHWTSYGFVSYLDVLKCAELENFHVGFATIPLDTWFTHKSAASLFRESANRLSLLVHGNNHTRHELAKPYSAHDRGALLDQAQRRIRRLERQGAISVSRVMVPPHGACSAEMLASLPGAGFDAACISAGSLLTHNPAEPWTALLGFRPAERIRGCPVLPRWPFTDGTESELLVAAYLGRPMIVRGHHGDLREGLEPMIGAARFMNGLGAVHWGNISDLARSSYRLRICGSTALLQAYANTVELRLPEQVTSLVIIPANEDSGTEHYTIATGESTRAVALPAGLFQLDGASITVTRTLPAVRTPETPRPRLLAGSIARRLLTEGRDRMMTIRRGVATR